ncbi:MAG: cupin domain-containing protein [Candidatus Omnitrophota bacterium]|nr:cupin domain-containing protein [Candidatus Omnitrophota bacterium]MBU1928822.1 cupin domain-containing protein [Candidatus Omnitrophota bacterium]MBU2035500.1 cupin domain-containing protein [Candidatus Omnitrophota bacterium]MBU2222126.1 cupin domain-containing protein [Candidatus Omnitrophota bacterium]
MRKLKQGNIYSNISAIKNKEVFQVILKNKKLKIERIISKGQVTERGKWLKERRGEWVMLLKGAGKLRFLKDNRLIKLRAGDYIFIPANTAHRVEWTSLREKTVWLAVYIR